MTRHIIDRNRDDIANRLRRYLALERQMAPRSAAQGPRRTTSMQDAGRRLQEFLRIERGHRV